MIQLYHVCKKYDSSGFVLNDISLLIKKGEWVVLKGQGKSGKTSLFKLLYGADRPDSGEIIVCGQNLSCIKKEDISLYRRQLGIISQERTLLKDKNVWGNIEIILRCNLRVYGFSPKAIKARICEVLSLVGLEKKIDVLSGELTEFEKRKLLIARAVINNPRVILADDFNAGLDVSEQEELYQIFKRLKTQDVTILFSAREQCLLQGLREIELVDARIQEKNFK
ncbi:MAG: ATP-binding cassette domain-containing protein [bacterium]